MYTKKAFEREFSIHLQSDKKKKKKESKSVRKLQRKYTLA